MNAPLIEPKIIQSPISGNPIKPRMRTYELNGKIITEAEYYDSASGAFIRKGIVSVVDKVKK